MLSTSMHRPRLCENTSLGVHLVTAEFNEFNAHFNAELVKPREHAITVKIGGNPIRGIAKPKCVLIQFSSGKVAIDFRFLSVRFCNIFH